MIAVEQEARQGRRQHDRIAHRDVSRGAAEFGRGPGHRHQARGAGEFRNIEIDLGRAVGCDSDDAGIKRERLLRRRAALQLGSGIAARLDLTSRPLHAVDQLAVEIADL